MKFITASTEFLDDIEVVRSAGTHRYILGKVNVLNEYFGHKSIDELTRKDFISFIKDRRAQNPKISNTTLNKYLQIVNRILAFHSRKKVSFEKLIETKKLPQVIPSDEIQRLFNHIQNKYHIKESIRNYVLFKLLLDTGLRISEALNIKVSNIDFETRTILVTHTKTKVERYVFFTQSTMLLLKRLLSMHKITSNIFVNYVYNKPLTVSNVEVICFRYKKAAKLKSSIRPHRWRHTFATNYIKNGGDLESLRLLMGHSTIKTTQIYLHLDMDYVRRQYNKIFG